MQTELLVKMNGEVKCLVKFSDFEGEPNQDWFAALRETIAGRKLPDSYFGKQGAENWIALLRAQFPTGTIEVIRR